MFCFNVYIYMYIYNIIYVLINTYRTVFQTDYCVYYMLFGIFTGVTVSYSLSVFYFPFAEKKGRYGFIFPVCVLYSLSRRRSKYRTQTGNMKQYPLWSPNNNYILLKSSCTNIKEYIILWIWYFSLLKTYFWPQILKN
jgi:hypothetical protein